jgi:DNA-3-methyladenine glycosylase I
MSYCEFASVHPLHKAYHDNEYGFPLHDDAALFERLILEINQAGLSWETILKKKENFIQAYDQFNPEIVAAYGEQDRQRLMTDAGIIRNRRKIEAAIHNAKMILNLREQHGSFAAWLDLHHPRSKTEWVKLFKTIFVFTGGEIVNEFLVSTGYLPGAHEPWCPVFTQIKAFSPPWAQVDPTIFNA